MTVEEMLEKMNFKKTDNFYTSLADFYDFYKNKTSFKGVSIFVAINKQTRLIEDMNVSPNLIHIKTKEVCLRLVDAYNQMATFKFSYPEFFDSGFRNFNSVIIAKGE